MRDSIQQIINLVKYLFSGKVNLPLSYSTPHSIMSLAMEVLAYIL